MKTYDEFLIEREMAYPVGKHYNQASDALTADGITMNGIDKGKLVAQGTISKVELEKQIAKGNKPKKDDSGEMVIEVPYKEYQKIRADFQKEKDAYIKANDLYKVEEATANSLILPEILKYAKNGNTKKIKELLDKGANVNYKDAQGNTALDFATVNERPECIDLIKSHGGKSGFDKKTNEATILDGVTNRKKQYATLADELTKSSEFKAFKAKFDSVIDSATSEVDAHKKGFFKLGVIGVLSDVIYGEEQ